MIIAWNINECCVHLMPMIEYLFLFLSHFTIWRTTCLTKDLQAFFQSVQNAIHGGKYKCAGNDYFVKCNFRDFKPGKFNADSGEFDLVCTWPFLCHQPGNILLVPPVYERTAASIFSNNTNNITATDYSTKTTVSVKPPWNKN